MRRFLNNLARYFRTTKTARPAQRAPRRAYLQVEGLEDRTVMSTASLNGAALEVTASPGSFIASRPGGPIVAHFRQITFEAVQGKLDVFDDGALLGRFSIESVDFVNVHLAGLDSVTVNYSNGLPFALGTQVFLSGSGSLNSLTVAGPVKGGETFISTRETVFGEAASLTVGGSGTDENNDNSFFFTSTIGSVTDLVKTTAPLVVDSFGSNVTLSGANGVTQTLSGLSNGGAGDTLTYSNKDVVKLEMLGESAKAILNATAAAAREQSFVVDLLGGSEDLQINATPRIVVTSVADDEPTDEIGVVDLAANLGPVSIAGNSQTVVGLGRSAAPGDLPTTAGIKANVTVSNVGGLLLNDAGNVTTQEHVTVTEASIFGTGLFGNNAVKLSYSGTQDIQIQTGQLADTYTVAASKGATFGATYIEIDNLSNVGLSVDVTLNAKTGLNLDVSNEYVETSASLFISALGGTFGSPAPVIPPGFEATGAESVTFPGGLTSEISYQDVTSVTNFTGVPHF